MYLLCIQCVFSSAVIKWIITIKYLGTHFQWETAIIKKRNNLVKIGGFFLQAYCIVTVWMIKTNNYIKVLLGQY